MDRDLSSVQEVRELLTRAQATLPALRELTQASRAIQQLALTLNEQPESLLRGKNEDTP